MKILLVEDDNGIGQFLVRGLKGAGHTADWVVHGRSVASHLAKVSYDVLILDLMLPDIDGLDVCAELRRHGYTIPILILSARDQLDQRVTGLDTGADDYLTKPFEFEELLARLRALVRRTKGEGEGECLVLDDMTISFQSHTVCVGGVEKSLTPLEFKLIDYLARNANKALSRTAILMNVWGPHADVNDNTVDVYIGYLRKKLNISDKLETVRGVGFKLLSPASARGRDLAG